VVLNFPLVLYSWSCISIHSIHDIQASEFCKDDFDYPAEYVNFTLDVSLQNKLLLEDIFSSCHPPGVKKGFIKGEHSDIFEPTFLKQHLKLLFHNLKQISAKGCIVKLSFQKLSQKLHLRRGNLPYVNTPILPFVTQYRQSVPNLKQILMMNWHLIQQPLLWRIFKDPPIVSYERSRSLKDILVRAKL